MKLLGIGTDAKTVKGEKLGVLTGILYLAPANISGFEVCPSRTPGCSEACLFSAGRGAFSNVVNARIAKTKALFANREQFKSDLRKDILELIRKAEKLGFSKVAVRLNGTSDLGFEYMFRDLLAEFPDVHFYDYTKVKTRMIQYLNGKAPANYSLTFSRADTNHDDVSEILIMGGNIAAVFADDLPETWQGIPVIDGDLSDARFLDPRGCIVGLKAKGKAKKDTSGFVIREVTA